MTAINESGQVYFTFEELDFDGAVSIIEKEIEEFEEFFNAFSDVLNTVERLHTLNRIVSRRMVINRLIILRDWEKYDRFIKVVSND